METLKAPKASAATLTAKGDARIRKTAMAMIFIVGIASALLSWNGLTFLGVQAGFPVYMAWLLPVSIDGMLILGSAVILHNTLTFQSTWFGWLMTATGVSLSIFGNIASVGQHDLQSQLVHSIPPTMLFLSVEGLIRIVKNKISVTQEVMAQAEREAVKEAKRQERLAEQEKVSVALKTKDAKVLLSQSKRGGSKVSPEDPEVGSYKAILGTMDAGASKMAMVTAILSAHPEARTTHIALAMEVDSRSLGTTVMRAKAKLLNGGVAPKVDNASTESPADREEAQVPEQSDAFQEIVKQF